MEDNPILFYCTDADLAAIQRHWKGVISTSKARYWSRPEPKDNLSDNFKPNIDDAPVYVPLSDHSPDKELVDEQLALVQRESKVPPIERGWRLPKKYHNIVKTQTFVQGSMTSEDIFLAVPKQLQQLQRSSRSLKAVLERVEAASKRCIDVFLKQAILPYVVHHFLDHSNDQVFLEVLKKQNIVDFQDYWGSQVSPGLLKELFQAVDGALDITFFLHMGTRRDANEERIREQGMKLLQLIFTSAATDVYRNVVQFPSETAEEEILDMQNWAKVKANFAAIRRTTAGLNINLQASEAPTHPDFI